MSLPTTSTRPPSRAQRSWLVLAALFLGVSVVAIPTSRPAPALASISISQRLGFDTCNTSIANLHAFWSNTPYYNVGIYLGGADYGCTNLPDAAYTNEVVAMGWHIMPLWVGPQAPCSAEPVRMSWDEGIAYQQGRGEAGNAYFRLRSLGMDVNDTPVIYDMESFNTGNSACLRAAQSFIRGWTYQLHLPPAQRSGVYGSTCASAVANYTADFISGADWDYDRNTKHMDCVPSDWWVFHQRHKQYVGDVFETWNGVTLQIDRDCSDAPVYPAGDRWDIGQGCV